MALENQDWTAALLLLLLATSSLASSNQTSTAQPAAAGSYEKQAEGDSVAQSTDPRAVFGYPHGETTHGVGYGHHLHPFYYQGSGDSLRYSCALQGEWRPIVQNHGTHHHHHQLQHHQFNAIGTNQLEHHASAIALTPPATISHVATPLEFNPLTNHAGLNHLATTVELNHLANPAGLNHLVNPAGLNHLANPAELNHLANPAGVNHLATTVEFNHLVNSAGLNHLANSAGVNHLANYAGLNHATNYAGLNHATNYAGLNHLVNPAGLNHLANSAGFNHLVNPTGLNHLANSAGFNHLVNPAGLNHFVNSAEFNHLANPTGLNHLATPTGLNHLATPNRPNHYSPPIRLNQGVKVPLRAPPPPEMSLSDYWNTYTSALWQNLGFKDNNYKIKYKVRPHHGSKGHATPISHHKSKFNHHHHKYPPVFHYANLPQKEQTNPLNLNQHNFHVNVIPIGGQWQQDFLSVQPAALHGLSSHHADQAVDVKAVAGGAYSQASDVHVHAGPLSCTASGHYQVQEDPLVAAPSAHYQVQSAVATDESSARYNADQSSTALNALLGAASGHFKLQNSLLGDASAQYKAQNSAAFGPVATNAHYNAQTSAAHDPASSPHYHAQQNAASTDSISAALSGHYRFQNADSLLTAASGQHKVQVPAPAQNDASAGTPGMTVAIFPMDMMLSAKPEQPRLQPSPPLQAVTQAGESPVNQGVPQGSSNEKQRNLRLIPQVVRVPLDREQRIQKRTLLRPSTDGFGSLFWPK